jgi:hypothetical protein
MRLVKRTLTGMALVAAVGALPLLSGSPALAAPDKDVVVVNTPAAPVPVTGAVEVVNDALHAPYIRLAFRSSRREPRRRSIRHPGRQAPGRRSRVRSGQRRLARECVFLDVLEGISPVLSVLPVQSTGPILGSEYYVANQPFKLRKDAMPGNTDEIRVRVFRDSPIHEADLLVTIHGYLVDL